MSSLFRISLIIGAFMVSYVVLSFLLTGVSGLRGGDQGWMETLNGTGNLIDWLLSGLIAYITYSTLANK